VRRKHSIAVGILAALVAVVPGIALAASGGGHGGNGGGNGTPSPPPTQPPCDSDGHNGSPPPYNGPNQGSGKCNSTSGTSTSGTSTSGTSTSGTSTSGTSTSGTSTSGTSTSGTSTSGTSTSGTSSSDICDTNGALMDETIGDAVADGVLGSPLGNVGGLVQDPMVERNGPVSGAVYNGLKGTPLEPIGTEVGCLVNVVDLPPGTPPGL